MTFTVTFIDQANPEAPNRGWKIPKLIMGASETITPGGTSQQSAAAPEGSRMVRVSTSGGGRFAVGADPTCTFSDPILAPSTSEYILIEDGWKVAVLII